MKISRKLKLLLPLLVVILVVVGCTQPGKTTAPQEKTKLQVVTTFFPMYDFTRNVTKEHADVTMLMKAGVEPHDYEPSAKDIAKIADADVFIYNSEYMETWVPSVLKNIDSKKTTVIDASKNIPLLAGSDEHSEEDSGHHHDTDEHEEEPHFHLHGLKDHYHTGDTIELEGHAPDNLTFDHYQWFKKEATETEFTEIKNETKASLTLKASEELANTEIRAKLIDASGKVVAETDSNKIILTDHHDADEGSDTDEHDHEGHSHAFDPHIWLDPVIAQQQVQTIKDGLVKADDVNKNSYEKNAASYIEKLKKLDKDFENELKDAKNRTFVTQHTAFAYLANRYNLEQVAISGLSPDLEPSPAKLAELSDFVKKNNISVIYFENSASPKIAKTLASGTGAVLEVLSPIEGVSQSDQDKGIDYIKVMEANLKALKKTIK
ncbi:metal ABC transporter substrate-binding protein [Carnobacterium maltaromaticum]|uniref:metal ABC transporter substrate-binding protein n=1 Tax=Carnobacterium maltaromaticum TaxID=2751 RepID=UPI003B980CE0